VPYQVIGGTKFYERAEIRDAIAYLSVLANSDDSVALARIINAPRRGIGGTSEGRLLAWANTTGTSPLEAIADAGSIPGLGTAARKAIGRFAELIASLTERAARRGSVADLLEATLSESGYIEALEAERTVEAEGRIENLQELVGMAAEFDANREVEGESDPAPLEEFLEQIALINEQDALSDDATKVTLMTLHNAKGLEYEAVFMIGCEDGVFPHSRSIDEGNLEEERRLCYVGLTRAQELLTLTYARRRSLFGSQGAGIPSRFLGEIPEHLVERHSTAPASTGWGSGSGFGGGLGEPAGATAEKRGAAVELTVGDDVIHASFGEGVVTAVEPGNVVVVRFRGGGDRKLMADYAPIQRAS
jgi:DNA helicase-2/ATP-dependent DNA helicase PcrA